MERDGHHLDSHFQSWASLGAEYLDTPECCSVLRLITALELHEGREAEYKSNKLRRRSFSSKSVQLMLKQSHDIEGLQGHVNVIIISYHLLMRH